ncbi:MULTISPECIES: restriction endonuclease subunit S [unclassified Campylobacter]|uniref:restriction endonuclease subunit S n=1 Tax=unclassified Campylobacter TaxID=2593542 RepID=UPI001D2D5609|nr:restriction endonuclease subunit S [Campylobacter sp. RM12651]MBZ7993567.1 restriction endonuclease subunit S [Campylobacter sp. RM9333]ULO02614.1 type I restriction/modification system, specificity subunit [Campylobacter sp. RM12651]
MSMPKGWEEVRLGDIATFSKGKGISKKDISENGIPCIRYGELYTTYNEIIDNVYSKTNLDEKDLVLSEKNDIIIPASGETAIDISKASCVMLDGIALGGDLNIIKTKQNGAFLSYYLNSVAKLDIARLAQGISVMHLYGSQLATLTIKLPPLKEQVKIAEILSSCDEHIKNLKNLKSELEKEKLHLMNELLSGKTRFANFTTPWQEVTLNDLGATYNGLSGKKAKDFEDGNSNYITYKNIFDNRVVKTSIFEKVKINDDEKQNLVKKGDIFFTTSSETPHEVGTSSVILEECENLYLNSFCFGFRPNESINSEYASFYFRSSIFREKLTKLAQGSTRYNLSKTEFLKIKIQLPSLEEQKKIGEVLSACDERLECLNELITTQTTLKSHLLTELLTGNIRV